MKDDPRTNDLEAWQPAGASDWAVPGACGCARAGALVSLVVMAMACSSASGGGAASDDAGEPSKQGTSGGGSTAEKGSASGSGSSRNGTGTGSGAGSGGMGSSSGTGNDTDAGDDANTQGASSGSGSAGGGSGSGTHSGSSSGSGGGTGGGLSAAVDGNRLVDGKGNTLSLRGVNFSGYEEVAVQGWDASDPSGGAGGQAGGPKWSAVQTWKANAVRIPLNEASWLGLTCTDTGGSTRSADPGNNYKSAVSTQIEEANAAGIYVVLDLHWAAPGTSCPMLQTQMADADHSIDFWTSVAETFKGNPAVLFELYNEPFFDFGFSGDDWGALLNGGTFSAYPATGNSGVWKQINTTWTSAGMQQMLNAVRATGAKNVVLTGGVSYNNDLSGWLTHVPSDPAKQLAATWHPYPPQQSVSAASTSASGSGYAVGDTVTLPQPNTVYTPAILSVTAVSSGGHVTGVSVKQSGAYLQTSLPSGAVSPASTTGHGTGASFDLTFANLASTWSMPTSWPTVQSIAAEYPVVITETGEHDTAGTEGSPFLEQLLPWADKNGISYLGWTWDIWQDPDDVLITDVDGTPTDGYGKYFQSHLVCLGSGQSSCP